MNSLLTILALAVLYCISVACLALAARTHAEAPRPHRFTSDLEWFLPGLCGIAIQLLLFKTLAS